MLVILVWEEGEEGEMWLRGRIGLGRKEADGFLLLPCTETPERERARQSLSQSPKSTQAWKWERS